MGQEGPRFLAQDNVEKIDGMSFFKGILTHKDFVISNLSPITNHAMLSLLLQTTKSHMILESSFYNKS